MLTPAEATVVIITWNGAHLMPQCLDAVLPEGAQVLVVDNGSTDGTVDLLARDYPSVQVVALDANTGFAGGAAAGLAQVTTAFAVMLNNDAEVRPGWLAALLGALDEPQVGAVCSKLLLPDGRLNSAGGRLEPKGYGRDIGAGQPDDGRWDSPGEIAFGCGAALALRMSAVREVGGFDPRFFLYYEDVDLCWRLGLAGWSIRYEPKSVAVHLQGATAVRGSATQEFWLERNRLATLVTCATPRRALGALARYPLTNVSIALFESRGRAWRRIGPYLSLLRWLPALLRRRRQVLTRVSRADWESRFLS